jgi:hypothetical protein
MVDNITGCQIGEPLTCPPDILPMNLTVQTADKIHSGSLRVQQLPESMKCPGASSLTPALSHAQRERGNRLTSRGCLGVAARIAVAGSFLHGGEFPINLRMPESWLNHPVGFTW